MKKLIYILVILSSLFLISCSGSMMLGYDNIYYSSRDELIQISLDNAYKAMDFSDDTLQTDIYKEDYNSMIINNYYENERYGISSRIRRFYKYSHFNYYYNPYYSSFYSPFWGPYYGYNPYYYELGYWSPYSYYSSYWGSPYYYNSGVYYRNTDRPDDVYVGHRRSNMTNRNVISTSNRSKSNYANYRDANRRTNTNSSETTTNRVTTTTRVPQKNSTVNISRRSSTYTPRYTTRTNSKPVYNRSTRTYQGRSTTRTSKSVYSKPNTKSYNRPTTINRNSSSYNRSSTYSAPRISSSRSSVSRSSSGSSSGRRR